MINRLCALLAALALALAQSGAHAQPAYVFSQQELDQMLAPIALYPDALLSQILMAATYPVEVQEAARWSRQHAGLAGDDAVRAAEDEDWDPSVKSLAAFPQVLERMAENMQWTQALGDAFLEQQPQVMDTVQSLRRRAQAAGNLRPDDRMSVLESGPGLTLQPYDPEVVYVPYYDPQLVYGSWWWPAYPPVYLRPWPGYYARPAYAGGLYWGAPVAVSAGFFFGAIDWRRRQARVDHVNTYYYNKPGWTRQANVNPQPGVTRPGAWHHDPDHRRGLAYRSSNAEQRFGAASAAPVRGAHGRPADARPDARFDARRPDTRAGVETRPRAPAAPGAPVDIRIEGPRPDSRAGMETRPRSPAVRRTPDEIRMDGRRPEARPEARTGASSAAAPVNANRIDIRQDARRAGTGTQAQGVSGTRTETRREPGQGFAHPGEAWMRSDGHPHPQSAQPQPGARIGVPPAPQPRVDIRPAPGVARPEFATSPVPRREPAGHHPAPQASPAPAAPPAAVATPRQPETKYGARPRTAQ